MLLVASLSFCGHTELEQPDPVASAATSLYQLDAFVMPKPDNRGNSQGG